MKQLLQIAVLFLAVFIAACSAGENPNDRVMKQPILRITNTEDSSGSLVLLGEVVNESRSSVLIPWLGDPKANEKIIDTTLGTLEQKLDGKWKRLTPMKDGIRPLVALGAGQSLQFRIKTDIPFPKDGGMYRLSLSNIGPVEFTVR